MFQTFDHSGDPASAADKLTQLRKTMRATKIDAYLVPRADKHQGEYVAASSERLRWLTGFSGSAGIAAVTLRHAAIFVDGRYVVQLGMETDADLFAAPGLARKHLVPWLKEVLKPGAVVGFDPWLITIAEHDRLTTELAVSDIKLKPMARNLVDRIWGAERPGDSQVPVELHPIKYAGEAAEEKIARAQAAVKDSGEDYSVITLPESIAWLLNMRGGDIPHTPVALAFALLPVTGKPELFVDPEKLTPEISRNLKAYAKIRAPDDLAARLRALKTKKRVARLDPQTAAVWFARTLGTRKAFRPGRDPCLTLKAIKNAAEIRGSRTAHRRDGVALIRFLAWIDERAETGSLDEIAVVKKLERMRRETNALKEISFDTIAGSGPNGAIVHYRVNETSNRSIKRGDLLLVDSGGQYLDGTTDVTRTICIGTPTSDMRRHYTLVLKGHIAVATARFPQGTRGIDLDPLARRTLWQHGLDYDHGTGHGVGSFLSVHEGPQSISRAGMTELEPGMILSNEPGYYKEGAYGIRLENLVLVEKPQVPKGGDRAIMAFETLTLVPFDQRLIDKSLLSGDEIAWLNAYHAQVHDQLIKRLPDDARSWLAAATKAI